MSNQQMAMAYSAKCERRRQQKHKKVDGVVRFLLPFSMGVLTLASAMAMIV